MNLTTYCREPNTIARSGPNTKGQPQYWEIRRCNTSADYAQSSSGRPTFINLDKPYPNHSFTLVIWGDNRGNFGEPPERTYMNQRICVTGMIESYRNSPQIVVTTPSQITREGSGNRALTPPVPETSVEQPTTESMQGVAPIPTNSPIPRPTNTPWPTFTPTPRPTNTTTPALQRPAGRPTMCSPYNPRLEPVAGGYRHSHCARIRNDGGCDRRFRPSSYGEHYHSPTVVPPTPVRRARDRLNPAANPGLPASVLARVRLTPGPDQRDGAPGVGVQRRADVKPGLGEPMMLR